MKKTLLTLVLTALAACSSVKPAPDEFTIIAEEWQGANINEMIQVWGNPRILEQVSADGEDGVARWIHYYGGGPPSTAEGMRRSRCDVTAYFGANGFISEIEVVSQYCKSRSVSKLRRP